MIDYRFFWSLFLRRLPIMLALVIVASTFGVVMAMRAAPTYYTAARMLVQGPQIVGDTRRAELPTGETLEIIEQQLMTRANLLDIANKTGVFRDRPGLSIDKKVAQMRANTTVIRSTNRSDAAMLVVGFTSPDAKTVADVVNEYTTLILSNATRTRVDLAEDRLAFYQQEVDRLSGELDQQNARILEFKRANAEALPENLQYRQGRMSLLQERVSRLESDLAALRAQRADMLRLFEATGTIQTGPSNATPEQQQLAQMQAELRRLKSVYAETSPRVRAAQAQLDALAASIDATPTDETEQTGTGNAMLDLNLSQIDSRVKGIEDEIAQSNEQMRILEQSIQDTATNAISLQALERDHAIIQARYDGAAQDLAVARTEERIELTARGQQITVLESAAVPTEPSGPNRVKIAVLGIGAGLALAIAYFVAMEMINNSIRRPAELRRKFDITPLAVIPYIEGKRERAKRRGMLVTALVAVVTIVPTVLWLVHTQYMPLDILAIKVLDKLGLA